MRYRLRYTWAHESAPRPADEYFMEWYPAGVGTSNAPPPFSPRGDGTFASYLEADQWAQWKLRGIAERHARERRTNGQVFYYLVQAVDIP